MSLNGVRNSGRPVPWCLVNKTALKQLGERKSVSQGGRVQVDILNMTVTVMKVVSTVELQYPFLKRIIDLENMDTAFYVFLGFFLLSFTFYYISFKKYQTNSD